MKSMLSRFFFVSLVLALGWFALQESTPSSAGGGGLPGARPIIDAAKFPSLQAAFDAVPAEGGVVQLPGGTFEIREPLVLSRGDVLVQGAGTATHIKNLNTQGKPALVLQHPLGAKVKAKERLWRIHLANFRVTGNPESGHGIEAIQIEEVFLQGVSSSYHGGDGIRLDQCYEDPRISNCLVTYNKKTGIKLLGCHDIVVSANQFEENQDALHCLDSFNLCMTGNCVDDHLGHGVVIENTYGSVLSGNMIEECNGTAVILDRDCYGITLSANVIAHNGGGIDLRDAHGCAVTGNTFTINAKDALRIGPGSGRITVAGNNFSNSYLGDGKVKRSTKDLAASGLVLEATSDIAVSGNVFSSVRPKAVELRGTPSRRVLFADNVITDAESDHGRLESSTVGPLVSGGSASKRADHEWIVGTWRSTKLEYGDFGEWKGTKQIELVATSPRDVGLFRIDAHGKRSRAGDSEGCEMDEKKLFFGPIGSGLWFNYRRPGNNELVLDLKNGTIHAELRREKN